jgi:hypothetical protein
MKRCHKARLSEIVEPFASNRVIVFLFLAIHLKLYKYTLCLTDMFVSENNSGLCFASFIDEILNFSIELLELKHPDHEFIVCDCVTLVDLLGLA